MIGLAHIVLHLQRDQQDIRDEVDVAAIIGSALRNLGLSDQMGMVDPSSGDPEINLGCLADTDFNHAEGYGQIMLTLLHRVADERPDLVHRAMQLLSRWVLRSDGWIVEADAA